MVGLLEPVHVVGLDPRVAHVVATGASVAGRARGAWHPNTVGGVTYPITPGIPENKMKYH